MLELFLVVPALFAGFSTQNTYLSAETLKHQIDCKSRYKKNINMYFKRSIIYINIKKKWEYYHAIQTKLRNKIQAIVAK